MAANWHTLAGRLRWAIDRQPPHGRRRGLRLFQWRMETYADAPGTSLSAIQGYLRGDAEPSLRFIQEAARLLGVRGEWLAWGEGAPTVEAEVARRETPQEQSDRVIGAVCRALEIPRPQGAGTDVWPSVVLRTMIEYHRHRTVVGLFTGEKSEPSRADTDIVVVEALAAPLRALAMDPVRLDPADLDDYLLTLSLAIRRAIRRFEYTPLPTEADDAEKA